MQKKGVIEVQFNWIFVVIVGIIIMLFFITIVQKQKGLHDKRIEATVQSDLSAILTGAELSAGTAHIITIPQTTISYDCEGFKSGNREPFSVRFAFAPGEIDTRELLTWSAEWAVPYTAANFLMVTSPTVRYAFLYKDISPNESLARSIFGELPDEMLKDINVESFPLGNRNSPLVRIVHVGTSIPVVPVDLWGMEDDAVSLLEVIPIDGIDHGYVEFYVKDGATNTFQLDGRSVYIGKAALFGAIFADSAATYECSMERAMKQLGLMTNLTINRTDYLYWYYNGTFRRCPSHYGDAINALYSMQSSSQDPYDDITTASIHTAIATLRHKNAMLLSRSCPLVY